MKSRLLALLPAVLFFPFFGSAQTLDRSEEFPTLSGRVLTAGVEREVSGARVQFRSLTRGEVFQTETEQNGEFHFARLPMGSYVVTVSAAGMPEVEQRITVEAVNARLDLWLSEPRPANKKAGATVSLRELSIPGKARNAFEKGIRLLLRKDAAGSAVEFKRAIASYSSYYEAYYELGTAQLDLGHDGEAAEAFTKSIKLSDGRFALPYFALGMVLCHERNFAEADTVAKTGLSLEPDSLFGKYSLGWAELGLGRLVVAEKAAREILQRKADFAQGHLLLIEVHRRENNLPALIEDVEAYLKLDASSPKSAQLRALREEAAHALAKSENKPAVVASAQP
jgi:tetratricopeptide (TPR) repeat protein